MLTTFFCFISFDLMIISMYMLYMDVHACVMYRYQLAARNSCRNDKSCSQPLVRGYAAVLVRVYAVHAGMHVIM